MYKETIMKIIRPKLTKTLIAGTIAIALIGPTNYAFSFSPNNEHQVANCAIDDEHGGSNTFLLICSSDNPDNKPEWIKQQYSSCDTSSGKSSWRVDVIYGHSWDQRYMYKPPNGEPYTWSNELTSLCESKLSAPSCDENTYIYSKDDGEGLLPGEMKDVCNGKFPYCTGHDHDGWCFAPDTACDTCTQRCDLWPDKTPEEQKQKQDCKDKCAKNNGICPPPDQLVKKYF
jgi:hypothetical protein